MHQNLSEKFKSKSNGFGIEEIFKLINLNYFKNLLK
jgi:hypothetical protein